LINADGHSYDTQDAAGTIAALGAWWEQLTRGRVTPVGFEDLLAAQSAALTDMLEVTATDASLETIDRLAQTASGLVRKGGDASVLLPVSLRLIRDAGESLRAAGALPHTDHGLVAQLNVSGGGVPKQPVASFMIDKTGPIGDTQRTRLHHGRPWQAVCLWAAEVVDAFAAEGHPITYGSAGENITVRGVPWGQVQAGVRMQVGEALLEMAPWALPCSKNAQWFIGRDSSLMHHDRGPVSRIYASVIEPGQVNEGDEVVLEP
jgi:hypothetical protein